MDADTRRVRTPEQVQAALDRAQHKALEQARAGNVPTLHRAERAPSGLTVRYTIGSRTGGDVYTVTVLVCPDGRLQTTCDCRAGQGTCWHQAAAEMALLGVIPDEPSPPAYLWPARVELPALACPACGQVTDRLVNGRCWDCLAPLNDEDLYGRPS